MGKPQMWDEDLPKDERPKPVTEKDLLRQTSPNWESAKYIPPSPDRKRYYVDGEGKLRSA